ncbi:hypothetical protein AJ79_03124 [Helicocarpus griseus UAMH5409]|uniref:IDI-2 n=1 Tax=Helicocarpus griseus UAMH5409 TaxID=1447875 RepID=A0A2B7Y0A6_9EURO|nr:hypothetical protein AJ79_03124 [Helicocarpus griseus UAMH5409]
MKFNLALVSLTVTGALSAMVGRSTVDECGSLGVNNPDFSKLPADIDRNNIRKCADHPLGRRRSLLGASLAPSNVEIRGVPFTPRAPDDIITTEKMECQWSAPLGCSGNWCWKSCGNDGQWCWLAKDDGHGDWKPCSKWQDCMNAAEKLDCGKGIACGACGCSC